MEAWPIEEVWLRPLATWAVCGALPFATARASRAILGGRSGRADAIAGGAEALFAWVAGATALGPALVSSSSSAASHAFGVLCVAAAAFGGARARGLALRRELAPLAPLALVVVAELVVPSAGLWPGAGAIATSHVVLRWLDEKRRRRAEDASDASAPPTGLVPVATGASVAAFLLASLALPSALTAIDVTRAPTAGATAARWRLRVDPWDGRAMLAAAWAARARRDWEGARAMVHEAVRMGLEEAPALELEAELLAARGECDAARSTFDRALRARAATAFEGGAIGAPLTLGGYNLPPSLVTECGGLAVTPP